MWKESVVPQLGSGSMTIDKESGYHFQRAGVCVCFPTSHAVYKCRRILSQGKHGLGFWSQSAQLALGQFNSEDSF